MMGSFGFAQILAERVLNSIPEGLLIAAFAWLLLRVVGRQNSGTRFAVWFFALLAIVAVPFIPAVPIAGTLTQAAHAELTLPGSWALALVGMWGLIALLASARLVHGLWRVCSLRKQADPLERSELDPVLRRTVEECQTIRRVEIRTSADIRVPTAIGFFKPVILFPEWTLQELPAEELRAVVLHEFAHLRRWDDWTNLVQKVVRAFFFFHPAVLWIESRLSLEREMACDDAVLAETQNPRLYAQCLVSLAEKSFVRRSLAVAQAAVGRAHETSLRIAQILDIDRPKATRVFKPALAAVTAFVAVCIVAVPDAPRLVSFRASAPATGLEAGNYIQSAPQLPKSMVIPAVANVDRIQTSPSKPTKVTHVRTHRAEVPKTVFAKHNITPKQNQPVLVEASAKETMPVPQYLVITQSTDYYREGSAVMSVSVWRMTLLTVHQPVARVNKAPNQT
jgi:beta-lactamase regulating signal transducer with metallopeptidase domain